MSYKQINMHTHQRIQTLPQQQSTKSFGSIGCEPTERWEKHFTKHGHAKLTLAIRSSTCGFECVLNDIRGSIRMSQSMFWMCCLDSTMQEVQAGLRNGFNWRWIKNPRYFYIHFGRIHAIAFAIKSAHVITLCIQRSRFEWFCLWWI